MAGWSLLGCARRRSFFDDVWTESHGDFGEPEGRRGRRTYAVRSYQAVRAYGNLNIACRTTVFETNTVIVLDFARGVLALIVLWVRQAGLGIRLGSLAPKRGHAGRPWVGYIRQPENCCSTVWRWRRVELMRRGGRPLAHMSLPMPHRPGWPLAAVRATGLPMALSHRSFKLSAKDASWDVVAHTSPQSARSIQGG